MSREELAALAEDQTVEFKKSPSLRKEVITSLCSMVNADTGHGTVIFGVTDDGQPSGIEGNIDTIQRSLANHTNQKIDPALNVEMHVLQCEKHTLLMISAQRNRATPYHEYDGSATIRVGATNRKLDVKTKQALLKARDRDNHNGPWICDTCGAYVQILPQPIIENGKVVENSYICGTGGCGGQYWPA